LGAAWSHNNLGAVLLITDDLEEARHHLEQAQTIFREVGAPSPMPGCNLGWIHLRQGDPTAANAAFVEALRDFELLHLHRDASLAIVGLACSAAARHEWERAACLLGLADAEKQNSGASWYDPERTYREQSLTSVGRRLGTEFDRCYDSGRAGDRGDLIDFALGYGHTP
jgi:hypothetical protein